MSEMTTKPQAHPWFVWESEYLEGCTIIAATSAEAAQEEYRRMSGADPETPLDAKPVTAEDVVRLETELEQVKEENARLRERVQSARRAALEEAAAYLDGKARVSMDAARYSSGGPTWRDVAEWEQEYAAHIRALITGAGEGETVPAPHPMEKAARLVDEWSTANFRTSKERPEPSALLDLAKRIAAKETP